jgi:hypothetical protein
MRRSGGVATRSPRGRRRGYVASSRSRGRTGPKGMTRTRCRALQNRWHGVPLARMHEARPRRDWAAGSVSARRLDAAGLAALALALEDQAVVARYAAMVVTVPGSECRWWFGAVSGRGHGRFWMAPGRVMIAHRFGFAAVHGVAALESARLLGHRCDNPLCQRIGTGHVVVSSALENRREWASRRHLTGGPLSDPRGSRRQAQALRDLAALTRLRWASIWRSCGTCWTSSCGCGERRARQNPARCRVHAPGTVRPARRAPRTG